MWDKTGLLLLVLLDVLNSIYGLTLRYSPLSDKEQEAFLREAGATHGEEL